MAETTEIFKIKCGQIFILSTDVFSIICEFCEEGFYTLEDLRAHLTEHFSNTPPKIKMEEPVDIDCEIIISSDAEDFDDDGSDSIVAEGSLFVEESSPIKLENTQHREQEWEGWAAQNEDDPHKVKISSDYQSNCDEVKEEVFNLEESDAYSKGLYSHLYRTRLENFFKLSNNSNFEDDKADSNGTNTAANNIKIPESDDLETKPKSLFECSYCSQTFRRKKILNNHENTHTGKLPQCHKCFKTFTTFENLKNHLKLHKEDLQCKLCSRIYINKTKLNAHIKMKHLPKTDPRRRDIPCTLCDVKLTSVFHLNQHMEAHERKTSRKTAIYTCDYCRKQFKLKGNMTVHMKMHSGLKPYKCNYCQLTFARHQGKTAHERRCKQLDK